MTKQEDQDFELALKLSKEESRSSRIEDDLEVDDDDVVVEVDLSDEDEVVSDMEEEDESDAFSGESDEEFEAKPAKKKGAAAKAPVPPRAKAPSKATKAPATKPAPASKKAKIAPAPVNKVSASIPISSKPDTEKKAVRKPSFPTPSGVRISEGGPVRRVGLSKMHAPQGPLSPVKIRKPN